MNQWKQFLGKTLLSLCLLILQLTISIILWFINKDLLLLFFIISYLISIISMISIIIQRKNPNLQIAWLVITLTFPLSGIFLLLFHLRAITKYKMHQQFDHIYNDTNMNLLIQPDLWNDLKEMDRDAYQQANYIKRYSLCPIYKSESCSYLTPGEAVMPIMVEELKKAKEFIFIEYFTIGKSLFWNTLLQELIEKAKQGVEIRIIYDAYGSRKTLPRNYDKCLEAMGLKCRVFHPLTPLHLLRANYRDHRKMLIIDGTIVFTGGMNLDDEYINVNQKYGYWKDSVLKLNGAPVWNFTVMFLSTWNYISKSKEDILHYKKEVLNDNSLKAVGFIQPFADTPLDNERISETVYLNLIQKANDYLYLSTPYLILDQVMMNALCTAAKNGIDVRIITPHIPDKQLVHLLTRSFYDELLKAGIKIYEFTPGFIHIKSLVADDKIAILGTVNMDYRSFNQDLECGLWIYGDPCISHIKQDFLSIMDVSEVISESQSKKEAWVTRLANSILQIFAPLF